MDLLTTWGALLLGLAAWGLGLAALVRGRTGLCTPSLACCAAALFLVILHGHIQVREGDLAAIEDARDAFTACAAVLLAGTLALIAGAWLRAGRGTPP